jgi:plasmid stabilization system protein ParE
MLVSAKTRLVPKTYNVYITNSAEQDILDIWNYIRDASRPNAKKFIGQNETEIATLKKYSHCCLVIKETDLPGIEYRHLVSGNYRIIFKLAVKNVYIIGIVHTSRILKF